MNRIHLSNRPVQEKSGPTKPQPPFDSQPKVERPGHEADMEPRADHGEESYVGHDRLTNCKALITGGDSGIGKAIAIAFAREGADVAISYLSEDEDALETVQWVEKAGRKGRSYQLDQQRENECEQLIANTVQEFGRIDILVNNAAFQASYPDLTSIPTEEFDRAFRTNVYGTFYLSRAALPHMPGGGSIINTTSIQSFDPTGGLGPYAATKAAISNLTLSMAQLSIDQGIRVNAVAPGPVWTPLIPSTLPKEKVENFGKNTLFKRPAQPVELAPLYVFLASKEASYVTGEIFGATGGRMQV